MHMEYHSYTEEDIKNRINIDNPWWQPDSQIDPYFEEMTPRPYLELLYPLVKEKKINRAVVIMGPRRVGKTVIINHIIQKLISEGFDPKRIVYSSVDTPIYTKLSLEKILTLAANITSSSLKEPMYVFFDEVQYLKDWEIHLKSLVDTFRNIKFIASGSAAAALRLKSQESGAGRFTNFILPPLSFFEFIELSGNSSKLKMKIDESKNKRRFYIPFNRNSQELLDNLFEEYINYGGYPELLHKEETKINMERYIKGDIIEKVLLKDLPGLYGIQDIQELNALFSSLAYNTGKETSLDSLSKNSGVAKNTIKRYIEYLEAAFLIKIFRRVDFNSKVFKRDNFFKVYLVNSSMRSALFSPTKRNNSDFGYMVETAIFSQWFHSDDRYKYYARWRTGEVDLVYINEKLKPSWAVEIKWSNRMWESSSELKNLLEYCNNNNLKSALVTTIDISGEKNFDSVNIEFRPASVYAYTVSRNIIELKLIQSSDSSSI